MPDRLAGKLALVTAAGQGIGRAIAASFAAEGAEVVATDIDERKLDGLACRRRLPLDVRSSAAVEALRDLVLQEHGRGLDILVNCAGFVHHGNVLHCSDEEWDFSFDLNVKSMHRTVRAFVPGMLARKAGVVLNISSTVSSIKGVPDRYVYGATKAAVIGLTKALAADFITQGIRANAICPGTIDSPSLHERITERSAATGKPAEEVERAFIARQPMGRLGRPQDVAALALFLASDEAGYITGQCHLVDGGMAL
jgi:2-keto-3-deoxy-L-fuconate dehydrogenase